MGELKDNTGKGIGIFINVIKKPIEIVDTILKGNKIYEKGGQAGKGINNLIDIVVDILFRKK